MGDYDYDEFGHPDDAGDLHTIDGLVRGFVIALLPALALWCLIYAIVHLVWPAL